MAGGRSKESQSVGGEEGSGTGRGGLNRTEKLTFEFALLKM